jgi:hypothetical protein
VRTHGRARKDLKGKLITELAAILTVLICIGKLSPDISIRKPPKFNADQSCIRVHQFNRQGARTI